MKRMTALVLALSLALSLTACSPKEPSGSDSKSEQPGSASSASTSNPGTASEFDQDVEINIALHTADGIHDEAVKLFKTKIEEASGSAITVNVFENGTLGTEAENVTQLSTGGMRHFVHPVLWQYPCRVGCHRHSLPVQKHGGCRGVLV